MRKIDRRIVIVVSVIFIIGLAYGLMRFLVAQKEPPPVRRSFEARRYVKVEPVQYTDIPSRVSGPGRLASVAEIDIVAEASGKRNEGDFETRRRGNDKKSHYDTQGKARYGGLEDITRQQDRRNSRCGRE